MNSRQRSDAEDILTNASHLWSNASLDQKQRLQSVLFPEGLTFDGEQFGTAVTCLAFTTLGENLQPESGVASPTGTALALEAEIALGWEVAA
jgi:hypothetical protein